MLHLVCASRTPPSSPKAPHSQRNKPQESSSSPTVGQPHTHHTFPFISSSTHSLSSAVALLPSAALWGFMRSHLASIHNGALTMTNVKNFLCLVTASAELYWYFYCSAKPDFYGRERWWAQTEKWTLSRSPYVFTIYAQVSCLTDESLIATAVQIQLIMPV